MMKHHTTNTVTELNSHSRNEFVRIVGPAFEHSPWIAEEIYFPGGTITGINSRPLRR